MTYEVIETSDQLGSPVELYEFVVEGVTYRYTSGDTDYVLGPNTYTAVPMERTALSDTDDLPKNDLQITVKRDFPVAEFFRVSPPSEVVTAQMLEVHRTDTDQQSIVKWKGRVLSVDWKGIESTLYCENTYTSLRRPGLRRSYSRMCPHVLYGDTGCRLLAADFVEVCTVLSVLGTTVTSAEFDAQPDGFFDGGYLEFEKSPGVFDRRAIRSHVGATVIVTHGFPTLADGDVINAYPGCDHTFATCQSKFNNTDNFGGFPNIPGQNPFGGNSVF
jgi:uncharacterized phage protein (TIGR02218 family)